MATVKPSFPRKSASIRWMTRSSSTIRAWAVVSDKRANLAAAGGLADSSRRPRLQRSRIPLPHLDRISLVFLQEPRSRPRAAVAQAAGEQGQRPPRGGEQGDGAAVDQP